MVLCSKMYHSASQYDPPVVVHVECTGVEISFRAKHEGRLHEPAEKIEQRWRPIERHDCQSASEESMKTHRPSLFVPGKVTSIDLVPHPIHIREERLYNRNREETIEKDDLVLVPIRSTNPIEVCRFDRAFHTVIYTSYHSLHQGTSMSPAIPKGIL